MFLAMARKLQLNLKPEELPPLPFPQPLSGNELEGLLVRALRRYELQEGELKHSLAEVLKATVAEFRPSAHTARLEMMDLLAVKECTDERFLPPRFRTMSLSEIDRRLSELSPGFPRD
jgi:hypothetical protein